MTTKKIRKLAEITYVDREINRIFLKSFLKADKKELKIYIKSLKNIQKIFLKVYVPSKSLQLNLEKVLKIL